MEPQTPARSTLGRAKFGGGPGTLASVSLIAGAVTATLIGYLAALTKFADHQTIGWVVFSTAFFPIFSAVYWALFVDRSTLTNAPKNPESSIESSWYQKAASSTFTFLIGTLGVALFVTTLFVDLTLTLDNAILAILLLAMLTFGVNYLVVRRREG